MGWSATTDTNQLSHDTWQSCILFLTTKRKRDGEKVNDDDDGTSQHPSLAGSA